MPWVPQAGSQIPSPCVRFTTANCGPASRRGTVVPWSTGKWHRIGGAERRTIRRMYHSCTPIYTSPSSAPILVLERVACLELAQPVARHELRDEQLPKLGCGSSDGDVLIVRDVHVDEER